MPLYHLTYISKASETRGQLREAVSHHISTVSTKNNKKNGVAMVLVHVDDFYIQVLEGARRKLSPILSKIMADDRHKDLEIVSAHPISGRSFIGQHSRIFDIDSSQNVLFQKYTVAEQFDPYELTPEALGELITSIINIGKSNTSKH